MSRFIAQQIAGKVREIYENTIDIKDLNKEKDQEFIEKITTRSLAAFAISCIGGASIEAAGKSVTDGSDDNGIDAVFFNKQKKRLIIVQSKFIKDGTSEPAANELRAFRDGINDFLDGKTHKFNSKLRDKKAELEAISQFGVKCDLVLVYTGKEDLAKHGSGIISDMLFNLNGSEDENPVFKFHKLHKEEIFDRLSKLDRNTSVDLTFHLKEWGRIEKPHTSYYGRIYGSKVGEWWAEYADDLLQDNIRQILGETDVNEQIAETAENSPELFWYFNNGITVLSDSIEKSTENRDNRDFGFFKATNASVVNGAQTVSVLGRLFNQGVDLSRLEVPFRVIELKNEYNSLRKDITRNNNTQNTILSKDFIAQDPIQESLQKQLSILGFEYQVKRDDSFLPGPKKFDLDEVIESLVMISKQANFAATFRKEVGRFYVSEKAPYKSLFNPNVSGYRVANAIEFRRKLNQISEDLLNKLPPEDKKGKKAQVLTNGILVVGQLIYESISIEGDINTEIINFNSDEITEKLKSISESVFKYCETNYKGNYLRTLFQNVKKCEDIYNNSIVCTV